MVEQHQRCPNRNELTVNHVSNEHIGAFIRDMIDTCFTAKGEEPNWPAVGRALGGYLYSLDHPENPTEAEISWWMEQIMTGIREVLDDGSDR